jgi:DNA-binding NtrC family response regulator
VTRRSLWPATAIAAGQARAVCALDAAGAAPYVARAVAPSGPVTHAVTDFVEQGSLVIVDDEEMVLTSIASFLRLETAYDVTTFTRATLAIEHIERHDVDLVISDFLMPEMDGLQFLRRVRDLRPQIPRVILTGYADKENAIKAINEVGLFQYIEKPWNNDELRLVIRNGVEKKQLLGQLEKKVAQINAAYAELQSIQQDILKSFV